MPEDCWVEEYYAPMQSRSEEFLSRHNNSEEAIAIIQAEQREIDLYSRFKAYCSYGVYIATKI